MSQVYNFGKRNVFKLDLNESREGFHRRGRGRSFCVDGPKTEKVREPTAERDWCKESGGWEYQKRSTPSQCWCHQFIMLTSSRSPWCYDMMTSSLTLLHNINTTGITSWSWHHWCEFIMLTSLLTLVHNDDIITDTTLQSWCRQWC